ncbi:MAG: DUF2461 domain-containing protein [Saprospiraceae bacterium]|nr:DUF2461 domain-containing protein [Saprospiraceae bacterium]
MISNNLFDFLNELQANNNREWFVNNKTRFETLKAEFATFVDALINHISSFDPLVANLTSKDCLFRIYRDVRFSKDKSPYKVHFGAHISPLNKKTEIHSRAGYYIHLEPGKSMLGGGAYLPEAKWLKAIRQEIDYQRDEFLNIIDAQQFKKYFGTVSGDKLVNPPKGYDANHPLIDYLKQKSFLAIHNVSDAEVTSKQFLDHSSDVFKELFKLNNFLNRSLE